MRARPAARYACKIEDACRLQVERFIPTPRRSPDRARRAAAAARVARRALMRLDARTQPRTLATHTMDDSRRLPVCPDGAAPAGAPIARRRLGALGSQLHGAHCIALQAASVQGVVEEDSHTGTNVMANTVIMPSIGLGCAYVPDQGRSQWDVATEMIEAAVQAGVRHFDTAQRYGTEAPLGEVLAGHFKNGTLRREDVFVTTKTSNPRPASGGMPAGGGWVPDGKGYMLNEDVDAYTGLTAELDGCLETLQLDYVDLVLIHYPSLPAADGPGLSAETCRRKRRECWAALQDAYWAGKCRAIGVSNFGIDHLEELFSCAFAFYCLPPLIATLSERIDARCSKSQGECH